MLQELMKPEAYPPEIRKVLQEPNWIRRAIANRWILGWPGRVKRLIETGEYLPALLEQEEQEADALAENADNSLSPTEKAQLAGLSLECPIAET